MEDEFITEVETMPFETANDREMKREAGSDFDVFLPLSQDEMDKRNRNQDIFNVMYNRQVAEKAGMGDNRNFKFVFPKVCESSNTYKCPVNINDIMRIDDYPEPKHVYLSSVLTNEDREMFADAPLAWENTNLPGRQTFVSRYIKAVNKCARDGLYEYSDPTYDPMFADVDKSIPSLEDAVLREKEAKSKYVVKKDAEKVDRERMPPPAVPAGGPEVAIKTEPVLKEEPPMTTEKKFPCTVDGCNKSYKNLQGLKNHMKNNHPNSPMPSRLSVTEESILASTLPQNGQKLGQPISQSRPPPVAAHQQTNLIPQRSETPQQQQQYVSTPPSTPQHGASQQPMQQQQPQQMHVQSSQPPQMRFDQSPQQVQIQPQQTYASQGQNQLQYVVTSMPMGVGSSSGPVQYSQQIHVQQQPLSMQQQPQQTSQRIQIQQSQQYQQPQQMDQVQYHQVASSHGMQNPDSMEYMDEQFQSGNIRRMPSSNRVSAAILSTKMKCPHCSKVYKTPQNLQKHIKETHPQVASEVDITLTKAPGQTYYTTNPGQNRQEVVIMDSDGSDSGRPSPVIVRQMQHQPGQQPQHVQIIDQSGGQQPQYGQQIVHYQVQQMPQQRQQQQMPMEVDPQQGQNSYQEGNPGPDVMVVDHSPPVTPTHLDHGHQQQQQQVIQIQTTSGGQVMRHMPQSNQQQQGTQIMRQVSGNNPRQSMHVMSPQVHIIQQQPGQQMVTVPQSAQGERVTLLLRQGQQTRPIQGQIRASQQLVGAPQSAYVYQQTSSGVNGPMTTKYIVNTTPTHNRTASGSGENDSNDYYSPPPQLTPQQTLPPRGHRPNQGYAPYRSRQSNHNQVRMSQNAVGGGQKQSTVRYVSVQSNAHGQTYMAAGAGSSGAVQYIRQGTNGQAYKYVTSGQNMVRVPTQNVGRNGQPVQSLQQYPGPAPGQQMTTRVPYRARVKVQVPNPSGGQPRRVRPANMAQSVPQSTVNVVQVSQPPRQSNSGETTPQHIADTHDPLSEPPHSQ